MGKAARGLAAAGVAILLGQAPAAGWAGAAPDPGKPGDPMTSTQFQGVSCIVGGILSGVTAYAYSDIVAVVATGGVTAPVLVLPIIATGFAAGCGVAATMAPGLYWIFTEVHGTPPKQ
jgi:hypothetical protein